MRFPWLQVDADFIAAHAGDFGAHLGVSRREAMGIALDLWTWALARASDDAPPDGVVTGTGTVPARLLAGSVQWPGAAEHFTDALVACGLAVRIDDGFRLTGFDRYHRTWEKNRRRPGKKPARNSAGTGVEPARKTQTQTQTQKKEEPPFPPSGGEVEDYIPPRTVTSKPAGPLPFESPAALSESLQDGLNRVLREERGGKDYRWDPGTDGPASRKVLELAGGDGVPEVLRRFRNGLRARAYRQRVGSLSDLAKPAVWNANAQPEHGSGPPERRTLNPNDYREGPVENLG